MHRKRRDERKKKDMAPSQGEAVEDVLPQLNEIMNISKWLANAHTIVLNVGAERVSGPDINLF